MFIILNSLFEIIILSVIFVALLLVSFFIGYFLKNKEELKSIIDSTSKQLKPKQKGMVIRPYDLDKELREKQEEIDKANSFIHPI